VVVGRLLVEKASLDDPVDAVGFDKAAEDGAVAGLEGNLLLLPPLLFLLLMGMLSRPRTSSKLAPMLESKPSAEFSSDFDLIFGILAFWASSSVRWGLWERLDDLEEDDLCLLDLSLAGFDSLCEDLS